MKTTMWVINLPYAVFAVFTDTQDIIVETAPIGNWMKGKHLNRIKEWVTQKKGTIEIGGREE